MKRLIHGVLAALLLACPAAAQTLINPHYIAYPAGATTRLDDQLANLITSDSLKAPIASPLFTGDPRCPTATSTDNDTSCATTAFVSGAIATATPNVITAAGPIGSATAVPVITYDARGRLTAVTTATLGTAAAQNTGTSGATIPFLNGANTWSGASQTWSGTSFLFGANAGSTIALGINGVAGVSKSLYFRTGNLSRWVMGSDTTAESGSNAGAKFNIGAYDDAGAFLGFALSIDRATQTTAFVVSPTVPTPTAGDNTTKVPTTAMLVRDYQPLNSGLTSISGLTTTTYGRGLLTSASATALMNSLAATDLTTGTLPDARLSNIITAAGPIGDASHVAAVTYDAHGRLVTVTSTLITPAAIGAQVAGSYQAAGSYAVTTNNGSDFPSASTFRTNLGVAIGTNVEAWDTDLDCQAALTTTGFLKRTGAGLCAAAALVAGDIPDISATYLTGATAATTYAPLAGPTFTGDPKAPTATAGDSDQSIATTGFTTGAITTAQALDEKLANKGAANGYTGLDASSKVPIANLPTGTSSTTVAAGNDSRITGAEQAANKNVTGGYAGLVTGTWTPTVTFSTPGTFSATYATQTGSYTQVGDQVTLWFRIVFTPTLGTASGTFRIAGVPITVTDTTTPTGAIRGLGATFTWPTGCTNVVANVQSSTTLGIGCTGSGVAAADFGPANLTTGSAHTIVGSITYKH